MSVYKHGSDARIPPPSRRGGGERRGKCGPGHPRLQVQGANRDAFKGHGLASGEAPIDVGAAVSTEHPVTMAVRVLRQHGVAFVPHLYEWEPHGGTRASASALGVDEHAVIKTLVFEDDKKKPLCIL